MKTLSPKRALRLMAEVVAEFGGDYVYTRVPFTGPCGNDSCVYVQKDAAGNDCPSCLIGHVMRRWGISLEFLSANNRCGADTLAAVINRDMGLEFQVPEGTVGILLAAQDFQDNGEPWGTALAKAVLAYADLD